MSGFLRPLLSNNRFIHPNSAPNVPKEREQRGQRQQRGPREQRVERIDRMSHINPQHPYYNPARGSSQGPLAKPYTGSGSIDNYDDTNDVYLVPNIIQLPFIIKLLEGKTKADRTIRTTISCKTDPASVEAAILLIFKRERMHVKYDVNWFILGWSQRDSDAPQSLYDYKLGSADWNKVEYIFFTQRESAPAAPAAPTQKNKDTTGKQQNKRDYESQTASLIDAENRLRKGLGIDVFRKLQKNNRLFVQSKYALGPYGESWDDVHENVLNELYPKKEAEAEKKEVVAQVKVEQPRDMKGCMENMMNMVMMNMMQQQMQMMRSQSMINLPGFAAQPTTSAPTAAPTAQAPTVAAPTVTAPTTAPTTAQQTQPKQYEAVHGQIQKVSANRYDPSNSAVTLTLPNLNMTTLEEQCRKYSFNQNKNNR